MQPQLLHDLYVRIYEKPPFVDVECFTVGIIYILYIRRESSGMAASPKFMQLKEHSLSGESLEYLRGALRFDIGTHQKTKLKVLGDLADKTLLANAVAEKHADRLEKQFLSRWGSFKKREMQDRLRFVTVLAELVPLDLEMTNDAINRMFKRLEVVFSGIRGIEVIGAAEIEIVNVEKMKQMASVADEARKLDVIVSMMPDEEKSLFKTGVGSYALVHFHGVMDVGKNGDEKIAKLERDCKRHWNARYMLQVKGLYSTKTVKRNLSDIAAYLTKGGNENLIYKIGFGYDKADNLERQMLKAGALKKDVNYAGIENHLSLTIAQIKFLGEAINQMMKRTGSKNLRNGYLFKHGQPQKLIR